jgi:PAS domain S-box-containing protein
MAETKSFITLPEAFEIEHRVKRKDGIYRIFQVNATPVLKPDGAIEEWLAVYTDVTTRREALQKSSQALRELSDLKAAIDEHAIVAITDPSGKITYVNDKFCAISKYSREELLGQDHRIINSGYHSKQFIRALWHAIGSGRVWKGEIKNKAKDGTFYWVDTIIVPYLGPNGKPIQLYRHSSRHHRKKARGRADGTRSPTRKVTLTAHTNWVRMDSS